MTKKGVTYAVKALLSRHGHGHLSVDTKNALGRYVTTVIVGKDRHERLRVAGWLNDEWPWFQVVQRDNGAVHMTSPRVWH